MAFEDELVVEHESMHQEDEKKKKKRAKYTTIVIEKTDVDTIEMLKKKKVFLTKGKAILLVKKNGSNTREVFDDKGRALEQAIVSKMENEMSKVKLLIEE